MNQGPAPLRTDGERPERTSRAACWRGGRPRQPSVLRELEGAHGDRAAPAEQDGRGDAAQLPSRPTASLPLGPTHVPVSPLSGLQPVTEDHGRELLAQVSHPKPYPLWGVSRGHIPLVTGVSGPGSQTHLAAASFLGGHPELPQLTSGPGPQGPQLRPSEGVARQPVRHGHRSTRCGPRWGMSPGPSLCLLPAHTPESLPQHTQAGVRSPSFTHALWGLRTELTALCNHQSLSTSLQQGAEEDSPGPEAGVNTGPAPCASWLPSALSLLDSCVHSTHPSP